MDNSVDLWRTLLMMKLLVEAFPLTKRFDKKMSNSFLFRSTARAAPRGWIELGSSQGDAVDPVSLIFTVGLLLHQKSAVDRVGIKHRHHSVRGVELTAGSRHFLA